MAVGGRWGDPVEPFEVTRPGSFVPFEIRPRKSRILSVRRRAAASQGILDGGRTGRRVSHGRIRHVVILAVAMSIAAPTCPLLARAKELVISLRFVPTNRDQVLKKHGVTPASGPALEIPALVDGRSGGPDLVGENREHMPNAVPVRASSGVVLWASQAVGQSHKWNQAIRQQQEHE